MTETIYVMSGGSFFNAAFNGVATLMHSASWASLFTIASFFSAMMFFWAYIRGNDPMEAVKFVAIFLFVNSTLVIPTRSVHIV
ncbi:conjugal transfer protein TraG N-terminal domain-containing protein, partial [Salmonella enterica subsp. enterica serovar Chester]